MGKKVFSIVLALMLCLGTVALADYYSELIPAVRTQAPDFTGKTVILHSNDVHGAIAGYAFMPALRDRLLALGASDVLLADAGDFSQGEIYAMSSKGQAAVDLMNAAGYDVAAPGNHDFDFGFDQLMENLAHAQFAAICANVYLNRTGETILPPSTVVETASGLKLGFVGLTTPETASKVNPAMITDIRFSTFDQLYEAAQAAVDDIRGECDLVIGLTHLGVDAESAPNGYRSVDLMRSVDGIDFIIDGHSHTVMTRAESDLPIQSTGNRFAYVGVVVIDDATRRIEDHYLLSTQGLSPDKGVAAAAQQIIDAVDAEYSSVFATSEVFLNGEREPGNRTEETNLGDLIADAIVWSVLREGGIEQTEPNQVVGILNGGSICKSIDVGDVSRKDINSALPYGNTVAVVYVSGSELLEVLEASTFAMPVAVGAFPQTSGIAWTLDTAIPYDQGEVYWLNGAETPYYAPASIRRVTIDSVNGEPFDPEATYAVVTSNYLAVGGDTYNVFRRADSAGAGFDTGIPIDQVVIEYVTEVLGGKITAEQYGEPHGRLTLAPSDADAAEASELEPAA